MDELVELIQSHPTCVESEYEEHAFDEIRLPRAIRPYHAREVAMELADYLPTSVGLEVFQHHVIDHQSWLLLARHVQIDRAWDALCWLDLDGLFLGSESVQAVHALAAAVLLMHE